MKRLISFLKDEEGATAIEYGLLAALISVVIIATVTLKSGLMLVAKKQIGYTVARVATDLRLELLQALRVSRWQYFIRKSPGSLAISISSETSWMMWCWWKKIILIHSQEP